MEVYDESEKVFKKISNTNLRQALTKPKKKTFCFEICKSVILQNTFSRWVLNNNQWWKIANLP